MTENELDFRISTLGECRIPSPMTGTRFVSDGEHVLYSSYSAEIRSCLAEGREPPAMELAGPREHIYFDPAKLKCGIVTCGGLCPGLNDVIRSLFLELRHAYGVNEVLGFRGGYQGLDPARGVEPIVLTPDFVDNIHKEGGTVLGTSRGPVDIGAAVDNLVRRGVNILFTIGGDGTQRGNVERLAAQHGVSDRVAFLGSVDDDALVELYAGALAVVYPPFDEDFGYVTLGGIDGLGIDEDPSGNQYWGALITFRCTEYA